MSHGHSHHTEEKPGLMASSAMYLVLIIAGFVIGLIGFVKSMSATDHHEGSHGEDQHVSVSHAPHSWSEHAKPLEFSSNDIMGVNAQAAPTPAPVTVVADTTAQVPAADSTQTATPTQH